MFYRKKIKAYEAGLVYQDNKLTKVLNEGVYFLKYREQIAVHSKLIPFNSTVDLNILLETQELKNQTHTVKVNDNEIVLVFKNKLFEGVLRKGIYAYWKEPIEYTFEKHNTEELMVPEKVAKTLLKNQLAFQHMVTYEVFAHEKALLYVNDELTKELSSGKYYFWKTQIKLN